MSDSDESEASVPPREVCEERCQKFADVTGTDTALAMFYLQDRDWDVQRALDAFFAETVEDASVGSKLARALTEPQDSSTKVSGSAANSGNSDREPKRIRLMSWNIDGLDQNNLITRTTEACHTIMKEKPDVVYLQEVVPRSLEVVENECPTYQVIEAGKEGYFTVMLLRCDTVAYQEHKIHSLFTSKMGRNILEVKAKVKQVDCLLMTSHLESTAPYKEERKRQLKSAFKAMKEAPAEATVIFGGDLNLRDKELHELGGVPDGVLDLWEVTGRRPEARYTWDAARNDNLEIPGRPRCRFDRLYMRHASTVRKLKPVYFELVGLERIKTCRRFTSDHWGILAHFDKTS